MATRAHSRFCWVSPSHAIKYMENLEEEILWSRFQTVGFPESIMTNLTTRQLSMDWIVQAISYRAGGRSQDPKSRKIKGKSRAKCSRVPTKMTPLTTSIVQHTMLRSTVVGRLLPINPFLEDSFIKVGSRIAYSEKLRSFVDSIPEVCQQNCKEFVDRQLFRCEKAVSDTITRNNFVAPAA